MKKTHRFNLVSALLLAALVVLFPLVLAACDDGGGGSSLKIPSELWDTTWKHTDGDKVSFTETTATVIPVSGSEQTFTLKDTSYVDALNQTTMFFGSSQTSDFINYRDGAIASVSLGGVTKTYGWSLDDGKGDDLDPQIIGQWQNTANNTKVEFGIYDYDYGYYQRGLHSYIRYFQYPDEEQSPLNIVFNFFYTLDNSGYCFYTYWDEETQWYVNAFQKIFDYTIMNDTLTIFPCTNTVNFKLEGTFKKASFTW